MPGGSFSLIYGVLRRRSVHLAKNRRKAALIVFLTIILMLSGAGAAQVFASDDLFRITSIDVGKGDCFLVQTGSALSLNNVLVDTGYKDTAEEVTEYLKSQSVNSLDAMIISHYDKDHAGGAAGIIRDSGIEIDKIYLPDYEATKKSYGELMEVLNDEDCNIPFEIVDDCGSFRVGGAVYDLYPSNVEFTGDNDNDISLAAILSYEGKKALFAGDLEEEGIDRFLEDYEIPEVDILKLPHHGSEGDNTGELLQLLRNNGLLFITDGHEKRASGPLMDLLQEREYRFFSSADDGTVKVTYDKDRDTYTIEKTGGLEKFLVSGDWQYVLNDNDKAVIMGYTGMDASPAVPRELAGKTVKSIGDSAFYNNKVIRSVTVPEHITKIGSSAFSWCESLTEINVPGSVEKIGDAAFSWSTKLKRAAIGEGVEKIGESGFEGCKSLEGVKIPESMSKISESLFAKCTGLKNVEIPGSIRIVESEAFKRCTGLKKVDIPEGVEEIGEGAFERCQGLEKISIPSSLNTIGPAAFNSCDRLSFIDYFGTMAEWRMISIAPDSGLTSGRLVISCKDGIIGGEPGSGEGSGEKALIDRVPPAEGERYASSADNFAPITSGGRINKLQLDFSRIKESDVAPDDLKMTVLRGSRFTTVSRVAPGSTPSFEGGVKVRVNKKTGIASVTCRTDGRASLPMEDGTLYTITFKVDRPRAARLKIPSGSEPVIKTIRELFNTDIDSGILSAAPKRNTAGVMVSGSNTLIITPGGKDVIRVQYKYLNKRYRMKIRIQG